MDLHTGFVSLYRGCTDLLKGLDPSMNHRKGCILLFKGSDYPLKGLDASMNQCTECNAPIEGPRSFAEGCRRYNKSTEAVYFNESPQGLQ